MDSLFSTLLCERCRHCISLNELHELHVREILLDAKTRSTKLSVLAWFMRESHLVCVLFVRRSVVTFKGIQESEKRVLEPQRGFSFNFRLFGLASTDWGVPGFGLALGQVCVHGVLQLGILGLGLCKVSGQVFCI